MRVGRGSASSVGLLIYAIPVLKICAEKVLLRWLILDRINKIFKINRKGQFDIVDRLRIAAVCVTLLVWFGVLRW